MNSLRFGNLDNDHTKMLFSEVVRGIASYGNVVDVPTVGGEIQFDKQYEENPLVNAMVVGLISHDDMQKGVSSGLRVRADLPQAGHCSAVSAGQFHHANPRCWFRRCSWDWLQA